VKPHEAQALGSPLIVVQCLLDLLIRYGKLI
jgi:hypothetical protein